MEITITIPQSIVDLCNQCGWDEQQTKEVVEMFLDEIVTNNTYNQFHDDFHNWINSGEFEEIFPELTKI
jgi:hypothetical protein